MAQLEEKKVEVGIKRNHSIPSLTSSLFFIISSTFIVFDAETNKDNSLGHFYIF